MNALRALIDFGKEKSLTYDIGLFRKDQEEYWGYDSEEGNYLKVDKVCL